MSSRPIPQLALVIPCYNEEAVLAQTIQVLHSHLNRWITTERCRADSYMLFVDDGSRDATWKMLQEAAITSPTHIRALKLAANAGHQNALLAGLHYVHLRCDVAISLDADLQDDPNAIQDMLFAYSKGAEIVLGVRSDRSEDTWFKRNTAALFYKGMRAMGADLTENHADFRLMSNKTLGYLKGYSEHSLFLRALPRYLHQNIEKVYYERAARTAGESKYPLKKMLSLAWNGVTSFSVVPLRFITILGGIISFVAICLAIAALIDFWIGKTITGWTSIVIPLYLLGGLLMFSMGIVGEYLGKLFIEAKKRPAYFLDTLIDPENPNTPDA